MTCGSWHCLRMVTHSLPSSTVPSGQLHLPVAGFVTSGGGHTQTPSALRICGDGHGDTHFPSTSVVPRGQTQVPGTGPGCIGGGHTQTPSALGICGGGQVGGTHSLPRSTFPGGHPQTHSEPQVAVTLPVRDIPVGEPCTFPTITVSVLAPCLKSAGLASV